MMEKDFKPTQGEASKSNDSHKNLEFVNLSKDVPVRKSEVRELDFLGSMKVGSSSNERRDNNNTMEKTSEPRKTFSCNFCKIMFPTYQALGGHQKAHKPERELKMQLIRRRINDGALGNPTFPYHTYPSVLSTPPYYKPLGVRMDSLIQKPTYSRTPYSFGYGHGAVLSQKMLNTSDVRLRNLEGTSTNLATVMDNKYSAPNKDEIHHSNIDEISSDSESPGLDLSLKL